MSGAVYLRPIAFLYGDAADAAVAAGQAGTLAGGPIAFAALELIEGTPGDAKRETIPFAELAASKDAGLAALLERISAPRPPLAGLSLTTPRIMGVVNVTPDSFSDGGLYDETERAVTHAAELAVHGADIVDIGGESTRPGSDAVDVAAELDRVVPVLEGLRGGRALISVDTRKSEVMTAAVAAGAHLLNDVSALTFDPKSLEAAAASGLPIALMHAQGDPKTMQANPVYDDVLLEVYDYLEARIEACEAVGIPRARVLVDPGIGFGKTLEHNLTLLAGLSLFHALGVPILLGASRKRFIGALSDEPEPSRREPGSIAAALAGAAQGVQVLRAHDVAAARQALRVWQAAISGRVEN